MLLDSVDPAFGEACTRLQQHQPLAWPMPALMPVDKASRRIVQGLTSGGFEITFPRRLSWALKAVNMLPYWLYFPIMAKVTGWDRRRRG